MSQDSILREVDDELRSDRMRALWRRFGPYLIGAAVAVVLIVAAKEGWDWYQNANSARASDELYAALELAEGGDLPAAQTALETLAQSGTGGYPTLARFKQAELLAREGRTAEAVAAYDALANSQSNANIRELALVFAANILVDSGTLADVEARVASLNNPESPLRNAAREALGLAHYKAGNLEEARRSFEAVTTDPLASADLQGRMRIFLAQLISEGAAPAEEAPTTGPAADAAGAPAESAPAAAGEAEPTAPAEAAP